MHNLATEEKHKLEAYVSTTVLDNSFRGTSEQFVLHFHEQFRRLDEITHPNEQYPHGVRLRLLQKAVRGIPELRMVETVEEYNNSFKGIQQMLSTTNNTNFATTQQMTYEAYKD